MSTYSYEDCVARTFYGFTGTENNEFHPGYTFNLKWGAIDNGKIPLNISLGQAGGTLIDPIVSKLTTSSSTSISIPSTSSSSRSIGIGVGVGVGGFLLILSLAFYFLLRRRKANQVPPTATAQVKMKITTVNSHPVELPTREALQQRHGMAELPG
ncbi:hypothetical protein ETB97_005540 [Aspergillus alliaceus]|uniref:Uncharacterized protein n=1 Tax=Petromyces alliaceus TaxID=209559 RepID=A0A8H6E319_PETAA|nr:hypothetical protein ETB97_005540 [Aspergillus burnettii]